MLFLSFIGFTALVAIISYLKTRNMKETSSDGYFLGGRSLTAGLIAGSLLLTNLSTEQIVGLNGSAYQSGLSVMVWETLAAIAMVVTAMFLLPRYLKGGLTTVPQFLEKRYDTWTKTIASGLFLTGYVVVFLPIVLYSGSLAIVTMFDLPTAMGVSHTAALWICVWGIGIIGSIYAIWGGLKAVAISDTISLLDNDCYYPPDEMRNDTDAVEWNHSLSGHELRVAESRYDEATTDAVNYYYGDERYHNTYGGLRDETQEMRE